MGAEIIAFIVSNPWRSACIGLVFVTILAGVAYKVQGLVLDKTRAELKASEAALQSYAELTTQAEKKMEAAQAKQKALEKEHTEIKKRMDQLLKDWPADCDEAADKALEWFQKVRKKK